MRIRKHFHLSSLLSGAADDGGGDSSRLPSRICRLNQSPWDVFDSPPSFPQVDDGDDSFVAAAAAHGGTSANSVAAAHSVTNTKMSDDGEANYFDSSGEEQRVMCGKSDGKRWRCKSEAAKGNLLCEHHLELLRNYQSSAHHPSNKSKSSSKKKKMKMKKEEGDVAAPVSKSSRRVRARKTPAMSSNPYEFYYYSGFGPSWGKKRGDRKKDELVAEDDLHSSSSSSEVHEIDRMDYAEDDEEAGGVRNRRGRKPIKARSLKSLM